MAQEAILTRLPKDTVLDFAGCLRKPARLYVGMTLLDKGHVQALREACDVFDQLFDIAASGEDSATAPDPQSSAKAQSSESRPGEP